MKQLYECEKLLKKIEGMNTKFRVDMPDALSTLEHLCQNYLCLDAEGRDLLSIMVSESVGSGIKNLSWIASEWVVESGEERWVRYAVIAIIIEDFKNNSRETIMALPSIIYAAKKVKIEIMEIVESLVMHASENSIRVLRSQFARIDSAIVKGNIQVTERVGVSGRVKLSITD